jgi:hypothetical protein
MSKHREEDPVTEKLCEARRATIIEQINGLKRTIYTTSAAITFIILIAEWLLSLK